MSRYEFVVPKVAVGDNPRIVVWTEGDLMRIQVYPEFEDIVVELPGTGGTRPGSSDSATKDAPPSGDWSSDGVTLPEGTELRFTYGGDDYEGNVFDGMLAFGEEVRHKSPSGAMMAAIREKTGKAVNVNGWNYVNALLPGASAWVGLALLRSKVRRRS